MLAYIGKVFPRHCTSTALHTPPRAERARGRGNRPLHYLAPTKHRTPPGHRSKMPQMCYNLGGRALGETRVARPVGESTAVPRTIRCPCLAKIPMPRLSP